MTELAARPALGDVRAVAKRSLECAAEYYDSADNLHALFRRLWDARQVSAADCGGELQRVVYCLPLHAADPRPIRNVCV